MQYIHGTCVDVSGCGVLLLGRSGSGKSDLALRLIDGGARLVSDDQVQLRADGETVIAAPPVPLAGLLEVRGIGILRVPAVAASVVRLVVELVAREQVERLPEPADCVLVGRPVRRLRLAPFEASAAAKIRLAAACLCDGTAVTT